MWKNASKLPIPESLTNGERNKMADLTANTSAHISVGRYGTDPLLLLRPTMTMSVKASICNYSQNCNYLRIKNKTIFTIRGT